MLTGHYCLVTRSPITATVVPLRLRLRVLPAPQLAMSTDPEMGPGTWRRIAPGTDFIPLGEARGPGHGDFDSHICFGSAVPVRLADEIRVFYMGGDGPHYSPAYPSPLHRNSSFGLATLRPDGFVAV